MGYAGDAALRPSSRATGWWEYLGPAGAIRIAVLVGLFACIYWGQLYRMFRLWQHPDWSHGFLIPFFCLYIVNGRRQEYLSGEHRASWWGLALMVFSLTVFATAIYTKFGYPQSLSMITSIAGLILLLRGWRSLWLSLFPLGFLFLAIPPPDRLYRAITQPLQQFVAWVSSFFLGLFTRFEIGREGFNITYVTDSGQADSFAVAGACSGMRSLMAFAALGLAMACFTPRPAWQRLAIVLAVVPVALFCNVLRVIITGSLQMYGHRELATGTPHTLLGFLLFGLGFAIYLGILWILDHLYVEDAAEDAGAPTRGAG